MDNKFLCLMAQFDTETESKLKEIQNLLLEKGFIGEQTPNLPNHITLGTFKIDKEVELINKLITLCNNTSKIPISFSNIDLFGLKVLFISPSTSHELLNLNQKFDSNYPNSFNWVPHVTILIDNQDNIQRALPIVADNFSAFTGYIESISLYEFSPSKFIIEEKLLSNIKYP